MNIQSSMVGVALVASVALLSACGGSSSSAGGTGYLSLAVTDAPVDNASQVVVSFTGVVVKPHQGPELVFTFDEPRSIDLLALQGTASELLLTEEEVPAGDYEWVRLAVSAQLDGVLDSYIELTDGTQRELWVPSGAQSGLKLVSGFTVPVGEHANFTIDFDLRKSVVAPPGLAPGMILKPVLRLVDNTEVGSIAGVIDEVIIAAQCDNASDNSGAVYVYAGADITPVDVRGTASDPLISALVSTEDYRYEVGFLPAGSYTLAYTCDALQDDPEAEDELVFVGAVTVQVEAGVQTTHDVMLEAEL